MLAALNFMTLILARLIRKMLQIFLELNSKGLYQSSGKGKESCCLVFPSLCCSRATTAKNFTKKRDARAKLLFC